MGRRVETVYVKSNSANEMDFKSGSDGPTLKMGGILCLQVLPPHL